MDGFHTLTVIEGDETQGAEPAAGGDFLAVVRQIESLVWSAATAADMTQVAWAYYYFSVQFRESLEVALRLHPHDPKLRHLAAEECDTANLSPWPGVAAAGERMNHDEFMRRSLALQALDPDTRQRLSRAGEAYLAMTRALDPQARALSIASYEDGGLERVFRAMLTAPCWDGPVLGAFRHFLTEHIRFDSDPQAGHGALARHMRPDEGVVPLWAGFRALLIAAAPGLHR